MRKNYYQNEEQFFYNCWKSFFIILANFFQTIIEHILFLSHYMDHSCRLHVAPQAEKHSRQHTKKTAATRRRGGRSCCLAMCHVRHVVPDVRSSD